MSWCFPSADEAAEAYSYYKNKYYAAVEQKKKSQKQEKIYISEKTTVSAKYNSLSGQKVDINERLEGIIRVIKMLEGTGGGLSENVPSTISRMVSVLKKADESYKSSIKMSGKSAATLEGVFFVKTVEGDSRTAMALQQLRNERDRLEQQISKLDSQINSLSEQLASLNSKIAFCNATQALLTKTMSISAYEMNHYKKFLY
jgi:chromosome segregation ATPase